MIFSIVIEKTHQVIDTSTSSSQHVNNFYNLRLGSIQTSSCSLTKPASSSISALFRQHAHPPPSTSENLPRSLSDIPLALRPSSVVETAFTVHSYPRSTHLIGEKAPVSSLSAINHTDLPYHTLLEISRPLTLDLYHYPL